MYYTLNDGWMLVSYKGTPYGLKNIKSGHVRFMDNKELYLLLYKCNGQTDFSTLSLTRDQQRNVDKLVNNGILTEHNEYHPLTHAIPSRIYSNYFRETVQWSITGRCNYKCRHCFQSAPSGMLGHPLKEQLLDIARQFGECGICSVNLTGGEPLIRKDFFDIVDALLDEGIKIGTIFSNGMLINQEFIDHIKERNITPSFQISFDGVGWHDWMRGVDGAEKNAVDAIKLLKENDFQVGVAFSLCRDNMDSLIDTMILLESLGCTFLKVQRCFPQGEWKLEKDHYLEDDELISCYLDTVKKIHDKKIHVSVQFEGVCEIDWINDAYNLSCIFDHGDSVNYKKELSCDITIRSLYIGPNGSVVPCMSMCGTAIEKAFPNILYTPLRDILTDSEYLKYSKIKSHEITEHIEECRDCPYTIRCGGGHCRAMAIGSEKTDYLAKDEFTCYLFKSGWAEKIQKTMHSL